MKIRKTDYGTIILHWVLVGGISVTVFTGLRMATEGPDHLWLNMFDSFLPRTNVWVPHIWASVILIAVAMAYPVYASRSGLSRRVQIDKSRLRALIGKRQAPRLGAIGAVMTWIFFLSMIALIVTGGCLYFGVLADHFARSVHYYATWSVIAFVGLHVLNHAAIGGKSQLMRVFRPERLPAPPKRLDAVELLTMLVEQEERMSPEPEPVARAPMQSPLQPAQMPNDLGGGRQGVRRMPRTTRENMRELPNDDRINPRRAATGPGRRRNPTLQANPLVVAAAVAITGASLLLTADRYTGDVLTMHRIDSADSPVLDGDTSDRVWRGIEPIEIQTNQGGNLDGKGDSKVQIRAVHDATWAYFLFTWEDPTRSLKQLPLVKERDGWHMMHNGFENGDEHDYNEDKFSVLFTTLDVTLAPDRTFHASPKPIANAPATKTGRGLHYTPAEGIYADVWQWKATSGGPMGWLDDDNFGPPLPATPLQVRNVVPYKGGFAPDPGTANYTDNFVVDIDTDGNRNVTPRRLPRDLTAMAKAMGDIVLDPNIGEGDGARWFITDTESVPYSADADRAIPVGTVIPGVLISGEYSGDRADVRCAARWAAGHWALEVARRMDTQSKYDIPFKSGIYMRVSVFDHNQIRHTRHLRPIRVEVN